MTKTKNTTLRRSPRKHKASSTKASKPKDPYPLTSYLRDAQNDALAYIKKFSASINLRYLLPPHEALTARNEESEDIDLTYAIINSALTLSASNPQLTHFHTMFINLREIVQNIDASRPATITLTLPPPPSSPPPAKDSCYHIKRFLDEYSSDEDEYTDTTRSLGEHDVETG